MLDSASMDALSEILRVIKLDSAIYLNAEFSKPWCLASPEARALAPMLSKDGEHIIIYHLLCEGRAYLEQQDGERIREFKRQFGQPPARYRRDKSGSNIPVR
jgi:AraC-like DNA-binding protein